MWCRRTLISINPSKVFLMRNMKSNVQLVALAVSAFVMAGCSATSYNKGVDANVTGNTQYMDLQKQQLNAIQQCYMFSKDTAHCSILAAGTNATQILGGRPTPIRIAKSPGEIFETVATKGLQAAVMLYGIDAVSKTLQAANAEAGKTLVVQPEVVRPEVVNPVIVHAPAGAAVAP